QFLTASAPAMATEPVAVSMEATAEEERSLALPPSVVDQALIDTQEPVVPEREDIAASDLDLYFALPNPPVLSVEADDDPLAEFDEEDRESSLTEADRHSLEASSVSVVDEWSLGGEIDV
ncbi:MAG: hypothetical protein AAGF31_01430, partial [Planctomycetota bacterium]